MSELLDIVDEQDRIIGQDTRERAHRFGLLHREIWMWLYDKKRGILLQRRSKLKDRYPGLLGTSIAGHVPSGEDYPNTTLREALEEGGLQIDETKLIDLGKVRTSTFDELTQTYNETFKQVYAHPFQGRIEDIPLEPNEIDGFEWWPLEQLFSPSPEMAKQLAPYLVSPVAREMFKKLWGKIS